MLFCQILKIIFSVAVVVDIEFNSHQKIIHLHLK